MRLKRMRIVILIRNCAVGTLCLLHFFTIAFMATGDTREPLSTEELTTIEEAGTYPVRIIVDTELGIKEEQVIYITITEESTTIFEQYSEAIDAHPIIISTQGFKDITIEEIISQSNARAWSTKDGSPVPITHVEKRGINSQKQEIELSTEKGTKMVISAGIVSTVQTDYEHKKGEGFFIFNIFSQHRIVVFATITFLLLPPLIISGLFGRLAKQMLKISKMLYRTKKGDKTS